MKVDILVLSGSETLIFCKFGILIWPVKFVTEILWNRTEYCHVLCSLLFLLFCFFFNL